MCGFELFTLSYGSLFLLAAPPQMDIRRFGQSLGLVPKPLVLLLRR